MTEQLDGQITMFDLVSQYGKTYPEPSQATTERISGPSSKRSQTSKGKELLYLNLQSGILPGASWELVGALPGVSMTLNFGESPSEERESTLSQILQETAPEKYSLSRKACQGILNRAAKRGKELPDMLREALMEAVGLDG